MFKKYPEEKPEENQKVVALHGGNAYATEFTKFNERVPEGELPDGIIYAHRKSKRCWFMDIPVEKENLPEIDKIDVLWCNFPEEAEKKSENVDQEKSVE